jgi:hypothetical protein
MTKNTSGVLRLGSLSPETQKRVRLMIFIMLQNGKMAASQG